MRQNMADTALFFPGIALGGFLIATIGAASAYFTEKKMPTMKSVMRDFIIGGILVLLLLQLVPDSLKSVADYLPSFKTILSGGAMGLDSVTNEMEIQVGVPRF
jgi:hypothetical protein